MLWWSYGKAMVAYLLFGSGGSGDGCGVSPFVRCACSRGERRSQVKHYFILFWGRVRLIFSCSPPSCPRESMLW